MKIKITKKMFKFVHVFKISSKNKTFINKKFDALHEQKKIKMNHEINVICFFNFCDMTHDAFSKKKITAKKSNDNRH